MLVRSMQLLLVVFVYCTFLDINPEVVNQTINEEDTALFTCQATGTPIPNISWYFNGVPVDEANTMKYMISEMLLNTIAKSSTLTVLKVQTSDTGTYTCKAFNFASTDISSGVLTVNGKDVIVHININIIHLCKYQCYTIAAGIARYRCGLHM